MKDKAYICCFCGMAFKGYGNNPAPLNKDKEAKCCDSCDDNIVTPARIYLTQLNARRML